MDYKLEFNNEITKEDLKIFCQNIEEKLNTKGDGRKNPFKTRQTIKQLWNCLDARKPVIGVEPYAGDLEIIMRIVI